MIRLMSITIYLTRDCLAMSSPRSSAGLKKLRKARLPQLQQMMKGMSQRCSGSSQ